MLQLDALLWINAAEICICDTVYTITLKVFKSHILKSLRFSVIFSFFSSSVWCVCVCVDSYVVVSTTWVVCRIKIS